MTHKKKNRFDFESEEVKQEYVKEVIGFFYTERSEEIGFLAAEKVLDFFMEKLGEEIYRKALKDSKKLLKERLEDLEVELDLLSSK